MLRVVLDTSVIVAGLRSRRGASNALLVAVAGRRLRPLVSVALFLEYEEVLVRPENIAVHGLVANEVAHFLGAFAAASEEVVVRYRWRPQLSDPGDELVLETAVNGRADALATHTIRHFTGAGIRFGLRVVRPRDLIGEIGS